ncbi:MAG: pentapeptide repeat-containing protein [Prochlorococcus sp.]
MIWGADLSKLQASHSFWQDADLSSSRLQGADFSNAFMHRCSFRGVVAADSIWLNARLVEADFRSGLDQLTDLGGANFTDADLSFALFQGAQLHHACLKGSCLYGANFNRADLHGADLRGCDLRDTQLQDCNLDQALLEDALLPCK